MTYKKSSGDSIGSTEELETKVEDFDATVAILSRLSFEKNLYQESRSQKFWIDDIEFAIDVWPRIPPMIEIEGPSVEAVQKGLRLLGLEGQDAGDIYVDKVYAKHGIDLFALPRLTFEE